MSGHRRFDNVGPLDAIAIFAIATGVALLKKTWGWWR